MAIDQIEDWMMANKMQRSFSSPLPLLLTANTERRPTILKWTERIKTETMNAKSASKQKCKKTKRTDKTQLAMHLLLLSGLIHVKRRPSLNIHPIQPSACIKMWIFKMKPMTDELSSFNFSRPAPARVHVLSHFLVVSNTTIIAIIIPMVSATTAFNGWSDSHRIHCLNSGAKQSGNNPTFSLI